MTDHVSGEKALGYLLRRRDECVRLMQKFQSETDSPVCLRDAHQTFHRMKGNAALYGFEELGQVAATIIPYIERGDATFVVKATTEMIDRIDLETVRFRKANLTIS